MTENELKIAFNNYNNAILIIMLLGAKYKKNEITTAQYMNSVLINQFIIFANLSIFIKYGLHKG